MLFQLLHPVRRFPGEVIPARRRDLRTRRVPQRHQVMVQLGHVCPRHPLAQVPPRRHAAVQQHHRRSVVHPVQHLALADHLPGRRQPGQRPIARPGHPVRPGIPQRRAHRRRRRQVLPHHRLRRRAARPGCPDPDEPAGENTPARHADTTPAASTTTTSPRATQPPGRCGPRPPRPPPAARPPSHASLSHPRLTPHRYQPDTSRCTTDSHCRTLAWICGEFTMFPGWAPR